MLEGVLRVRATAGDLSTRAPPVPCSRLGENSFDDHVAPRVVPPLQHQLRGPALRGERALQDGIDVVRSSHSSKFTSSSNSSMGVATHAYARSAFAALAPAAPSRTCRSLAPLSAAVVAHASASPLHDARNSVACCSLGPTGRRVPKVGCPVRQKICILSQRWRQEQIFGRLAKHGIRLL